MSMHFGGAVCMVWKGRSLARVLVFKRLWRWGWHCSDAISSARFVCLALGVRGKSIELRVELGSMDVTSLLLGSLTIAAQLGVSEPGGDKQREGHRHWLQTEARPNSAFQYFDVVHCIIRFSPIPPNRPAHQRSNAINPVKIPPTSPPTNPLTPPPTTQLLPPPHPQFRPQPPQAARASSPTAP